MKALSIRQPWAWLIIHAGKDAENRSRRTHLRGRILVHASKGMTPKRWDGADRLECRQRLIAVPIRALFVGLGTSGKNLQNLRK